MVISIHAYYFVDIPDEILLDLSLSPICCFRQFCQLFGAQLLVMSIHSYYFDRLGKILSDLSHLTKLSQIHKFCQICQNR